MVASAKGASNSALATRSSACKFWQSHISGIAEIRFVKFCTQRNLSVYKIWQIWHINSKGMTNYPQKRCGWAHVTHFCVDKCGCRKISPQHAFKWEQCHWWWTSVTCTFGSRCQLCYTLRVKLYRFDLSLYMLQMCLYNMSATNRPSGVWASACTCVLITGRWWSV